MDQFCFVVAGSVVGGVIVSILSMLILNANDRIKQEKKLQERKEIVLNALHRETSANIKQSDPLDYRTHAGLALSCECCKVIIHDPDLSHAVGKEVFAKTLETLAALNAVESRYQFLHPDIKAAVGRSDEFAPLKSALERFKVLSEALKESIPAKFKIEIPE